MANSNTAHKLEILKIVVAGLDNAGKTSFLTALAKKYDFFEQVRAIKPTIKINYSSLNFLNKWEIRFWDMGGQEMYRENYLRDPIVFEDTKFLYYFIDVQDKSRIELSVNYLEELLKIYEKLPYSEEVIICLNKFDPKIQHEKNIRENSDFITKLTLRNTNFKFKFIKTSYFDIGSISKALSYSLQKYINVDFLNIYIETIIRKLRGIYGVLYNSDGLILSEYYSDPIESDQFDGLIRQKVNEDLILIQKLMEKNITFSERIFDVNDRTEFLKQFKIGENLLFLKLFMPTSNKNIIEEELGEFEINLQTIFT